VLCPYCGTDNPGIHRFCGMCGKPLDEEPAAEYGGPTKDLNPSSVGATEAVQPPVERPVPAPAYTGGIFNLGAPSDTSSRNVDYLLEDDEPKSHGGLLLFGVLALVLVVGLGWMRFRQTGIPGLKSLIGSSAPAPSNNPTPAQSPAAGDGSSGQPATAPAGSEQPQSSGAPQASPDPQPSSPAASSAPRAEPPAGSSSQEKPTSTTPPAASTSQSSNPATPSGSESPAGGGASQAATPNPNPDAPKSSQAPADSTPPAAATTAATTTPPAAEAPDVPAAPKPKKPKPAPARTDDTVALGEKYLYGRGMPQSCEKGLRYVKPAAEQSNPKAMITMGALYATGHCLSRDLPTAYRYFALALRQDPSNSALKQNTEMVWGQMTPSERQLAIRLTQ